MSDTHSITTSLLQQLEDPIFAIPAILVVLSLAIVLGINSYQRSVAAERSARLERFGLDNVSQETLDGGTEYVREDGMDVRRSKRYAARHLRSSSCQD